MVILALLFVSGCTSSGGDPEADVSILFIGNSYTYFNALPKMVYKMAASAGEDAYYSSVTFSGVGFDVHKDNQTTIEKIQSHPWDYVVLQNQSQTPSMRPEDVTAKSLPNAQALVDMIKANDSDTKVIYYQTWGRRGGDKEGEQYYPLVGTFDGHTQALREGYALYQAATGGEIAPVGDVWQDVFNASDIPFSKNSLWIFDRSHPTIKGSYLAGLTLFEAIFDRPVVDVSYDSALSASNAQWLRNRIDNFLPERH